MTAKLEAAPAPSFPMARCILCRFPATTMKNSSTTGTCPMAASISGRSSRTSRTGAVTDGTSRPWTPISERTPFIVTVDGEVSLDRPALRKDTWKTRVWESGTCSCSSAFSGRLKGLNEAGSWARFHWQFGWPDDTSNTLYVATNRLDFGDGLQAPGAGVFPRTDTKLVLTEPGCSVSRWRLPRWFYPDNNKTPLSYHPDLGRWRRDSQYTYLRSVRRGQEFVLDLQQYPEGMGWISGLVRDLGAD